MKTSTALFAICTAIGMTAASAACPPGYAGTPPHCMPKQASHRPHEVTVHHAPVSGPPVGPGPVEHAGGTRRAVSSGEMHAINSQPVPPGHDKTALNPQPIPPGHGVRTPPHAEPRHAHATVER